MTKEEIRTKVDQFLIEEFDIEAERLLAGGRIKEDIGIDSLDVVDIMVMVHDVFGIKLDQKQFAQTKTMDEFYELIFTQVNA